jgi:hypothetical protein
VARDPSRGYWQDIEMPTSLVAAENFIEFQLSQMAARNAHHTFEELATRIARRRISSTILLAAGPVGAGGDQGRDAESYRTFIPDELPASTIGAAPATSAPVVVACTTQTGRLKSKILHDVEGICDSQASSVQHIAYFSVNTVPAAAVHEVQQVVREQHGITIDVFSGRQIATILAEPDLIWAAVHYLELPQHMLPNVPDETAPPWYLDLLSRLRANGGPPALTPGIQGEVARGIRFATWNAASNVDLPEWIDFMFWFLRGDVEESDLTFRARYEIAVATLRGMGRLGTAEQLLSDAIRYAARADSSGVLEDGATLAGYWVGAWSAGISAAQTDEIAAAILALRAHIATELEATDTTQFPTRAATLTATLVRLSFLPDIRNLESRGGRPAAADDDGLAGDHLQDHEIDFGRLAADESIPLGAAMDYLRALTDLLPAARSFSVETIAEMFQMFAPALIDLPGYEVVRDALDEATSLVEGENAKAERCRDRAMALIESGRLVDGLHDLHEAKLAWFHGDTFYGAVIAMRVLAQTYSRLNLGYAAKYYACAAASLAIDATQADVRAQAPGALLEASAYAQRAGTWFDAAALGRIAVMARHSLHADPFSYDEDSQFMAVELQSATQLLAVRRYWPHLEQQYLAAFGDSGWQDRIVEDANEVELPPTWTEDEYQRLANEQLGGQVLSDLGPRRSIVFACLGVHWTFNCDNDRSSVLVAEALVAALQVLLADLSSLRPTLATLEVNVDVHVETGGARSVRDCRIDDSGAAISVAVKLSNERTDYLTRNLHLLEVSIPIVAAVHARPESELLAMLDARMAAGLQNKLSVARTHEDFADLLDDAHYVDCSQLHQPASSRQRVSIPGAGLEASTDPGVGYTSASSLDDIRNRYQVASTTLRRTLPRIFADRRFAPLVESLRAGGLLDWQILSIFVNIVGNWRIRALSISPYDRRRARETFVLPETESTPLPTCDEVFGEDVDLHLQMTIVSVASTWGLHPVTTTEAAGPLRDLMVRRYGYGSDDVAHVDLLDCVDGEGNLRQLVP